MIAEAWDAVGLYQVGSFPGYRWAEWNGHYRDDIRRFIKGDKGITAYVASRITGSSDIYHDVLQNPTNSINFITAHDGFTLNDLVSYNHKHNIANGEGNRDGTNDNLSWNCGTEGVTDDPQILKLRRKKIKNFASILLLSKGVPMILSGDEVGRSQSGNNNVYCHDNDLSWFDWSLVEDNKEIFRFFKNMIAFRKSHPAITDPHFFSGKPNERGIQDISWHSCQLNKPNFNDHEATVLAFTLAGLTAEEPDMHVMMNMDYRDMKFEIPQLSDGRVWHRYVDTSLESPDDILEIGQTKPLASQEYYILETHSIVVLVTKL